ncbi:MAG: hypothetical protein KAS93_01270 [Gammaproteobacteria bacterium]|nr:hypothetical protein [Gammaproteobacteria bacterium]
MKGIVGNYRNMTVEILQSCLWGLCNTVKRETADELNRRVPGDFGFLGDAPQTCIRSVSHICAGMFKVTECVDAPNVPYNVSRLWSNAITDVVSERCHSVVKEEIAIVGSVFGVALIILLAFCCCFAGVYTCVYREQNRAQNESQMGEDSKLLAKDGTPARLDAVGVGDEPMEEHEEHGAFFKVDIA